MWFKLFQLSNISNIYKINKVIMDCHDRLKFVSHGTNMDPYYSYDGIINIILHYYGFNF